MADGKEKKAHLPWGMDMEGLQPNSVKTISQTKLKAFSLGRTNPVKKTSPFIKKKQETEKKRRIDAKEAAQVFEQFVASFEGPGKTGKTFVRGSTINPESSSSSTSGSTSGSSSVPGSVYKPVSKFQVEKEEKPPAPTVTRPTTKKPPVKKGTEKKKSILELFREELKRSQEERKERHAKKESGRLPLDAPETSSTSAEIFKVEEYKDLVKGSFDMGDPLTTNLYVGNINPKMNEEMLCQMFGKYGPLASVKVMWPRTEEEKARNRNCGFVAFMKRKDAEKALEAFKGTTIMEYEVQVGWGKAVPLPPHPIYVPPNVKEEENAKIPDPPSGLPFNAQPRKKGGGGGGGGGIMGEGGLYGNVPPPGGGGVGEEKVEKEENFEDVLYSAIVRVVIPTDQELLRLIHRMIEFVIREGPMFEAMIMNKEINNPLFQFLFDNQSPAHIYYRWKLFSILQGDSPETWRTEEFRMFEAGSLWKPPPLKNLRAKVMPPVDEVVRRGQLSSKNRDDLEDQLRGISMERSKIKESMIWCLDHADSAEEIVECVTESLCIEETLLPMKLARLYLVNDILQNCSAKVPNASNFRRGFESKLLPIMEHFHTVLKGIPSRMRAEQFKRRVLVCLRAWSQLSVYHFNLVDKLRETFIGKTQEELEKQRAFETVAALISTDPSETGGGSGGGREEEEEMISLLDNRPIDFSRGMNIDGVPLEENIDGEPLPDPDLDGIPLSKTEDIDGVPMEEEKDTAAAQGPLGVRSKWELVDYGDDSDDEEPSAASPTATTGSSVLSKKEQQQLLAELDEKKRKMLREVELKVVELSDALEASGSYSKEEILERVSKFRDKLMQEAVEPKRSPQPSRRGKGDRSRSPSPSTLAKYNLENSPKSNSKKCSPPHSPERTKRHSPSSSPSRQKRSPSPSSRKRHHTPSPSRGRRSRSPETKKRRKHSSSPSRRRSHSRSPRRRSRSRSPTSRNTSHSHSPKRRSRSPRKQRSKSRSPRRRSRSRSPPRRRSRSRSPRHSSSSKRRSRSRSPKSRRHRSRSRSPRSSKKSKRRSRSPSPHKSSRSSSSRKSKH